MTMGTMIWSGRGATLATAGFLAATASAFTRMTPSRRCRLLATEYGRPSRRCRRPATCKPLKVSVAPDQDSHNHTESLALENADLAPLALVAPPVRGVGQLQSHNGTAAMVVECTADRGDTIDSAATVQQLPLYQLALAGSLTTLLADLTMHPMDCIKTIQQSSVGVDMNLMQAAQYLYETAGVAGFYHGFLTYGASDSLGGALKFTVWEIWKRTTADWRPMLLYLWIGAGLAFVASSIIVVPGELIKNQLQMEHYASLPAAVTGILATQGLPGFFVGYEGVLYRDVPYTMLELGLYEVLQKFLFARNNDVASHKSASPWQDITAAALTGGITALLTTPLDTIKTKMMVDNVPPDSTFISVLLDTVQKHGPLAIFAGVFARICWILPFTAIYLPTYDFLKRKLVELQLASAAAIENDEPNNAGLKLGEPMLKEAVSTVQLPPAAIVTNTTTIEL